MGDNDNDGGNEGGNDGANQFKAPADQAALDAIIERRLARERQKFGDYDELKTKATAYDEAEAKNASAIEKAQKEATDAASKASGLGLQLLEERVEAAVLRAAKDLVDPDAAARLIDRSAIDYGDDGKPKNIPALLDALVKDKPYLKAKNTTTTRTSAPRTKPDENGEKNENRDGKGRANEALASWIGSR